MRRRSRDLRAPTFAWNRLAQIRSKLYKRKQAQEYCAKSAWCRRGTRSPNKGHTLKNWFLLILMVVALLYAFPYHPDPQQQPVQLPAEAVPLENNRTNPYDKPPRPPKAQAPALKFGGYPCIGDCSDDKAGYRWAEQNGITDPDSCTGNTGEFIEGCRVYARQRAAGAANK